MKKAGRAGQLPSGVVLTGGGAKLKGIAEYAKEQLGLAVRVGKPGGFGGVADQIEEPQFATAVGLMLVDVDDANVRQPTTGKRINGAKAVKQASGILSKLLSRFKA